MRSNAKQVMAKLSKTIDKTLKDAPKVLGNEGQKQILENFNRKSFEGKKWAEVKRRIPGTYEYKYPKNKYLARHTNPILVGRTRRLKNALTRTFKSGISQRMIWGVYVPYAEALNNGGKHLKARKFMAASPKFKKSLLNKLTQMIKYNLKTK